jgi:hypothetical protein
MGREENKENAPDLFAREVASPPSAAQSDGFREARPPKWALPKDLGRALEFLNDEQIDRLISAVTEEVRRRDRRHPDTEWPDVAKTESIAGAAKPVPKQVRSKTKAEKRMGYT